MSKISTVVPVIERMNMKASIAATARPRGEPRARTACRSPEMNASASNPVPTTPVPSRASTHVLWIVEVV
jgi:hypothetical protein